MNKKQLQKIIDTNIDAAEMGDPKAQGLVIRAQDEHDKLANLERLEWWPLISQL